MCVKLEESKKNKLNQFIIPESTKHTIKEKITLDFEAKRTKDPQQLIHQVSFRTKGCTVSKRKE